MTSGKPTRLAIFILSILIASAFIGPAFSQGIEFADGLVYNNFYAVTVHHSDGENYTIFDAASFEGEVPPWPDNEGNFGAGPGSNPGNGMKYFFWVRRIGDTGAITYPLAFSKILEINFNGPYGGTVTDLPQEGVLTVDDEEQIVSVLLKGGGGPERFSGWFGNQEPPIPSFTPAAITLTDGTEQEVFIKTDGFLGGIDEEFGTYAMLWMQHDAIQRLVFKHNGSYARCPECGAIFYDGRNEICPFDGETLIPPRER